MVKIKDQEVKDNILFLIKEIRERQKELELTKEVYKSSLSLYFAIKNKIFFPNLILHPLCLEKGEYYTYKEEVTTLEELEVLLKSIIEYELDSYTKDELTSKERDVVIKKYRTLKKKSEKQDSLNTQDYRTTKQD